MARTVLLLARETGWPESLILGLSIERLNTYARELNKLNSEKSEI